MSSRLNAWLREHRIRIAANPAISPDWCLDWPGLQKRLRVGQVVRHPRSGFATAYGQWLLAEDADGDHAWIYTGSGDPGLLGGERIGASLAYPATWANLLRLKDLVQEHDAGSTIFPTAHADLARRSLGIGARLTTLHWPGVAWAMAALKAPLTANQNSIPRELVYDGEAMLDGRLDRVPFPFLGTSVPEGHQGQTVEGMSQGAVLSFLKLGFHRKRIAWGFNADHQPVGGIFDAREKRLVEGALLASYITFDLSPELGATVMPTDPVAWVRAEVPSSARAACARELAALGLDPACLDGELARLWPALLKLQRRDQLSIEARSQAFSTRVGRAFLRELSIDELPGLTSPATLAVALAGCRALGLEIHYVAPAFGFQKNLPFGDESELERRVEAAWRVCRHFGCSIGFHSGSGKSAADYRVCGRVTGGRLEIKTSGRFTYEFARALAASPDPGDQALWREWFAFACSLAAQGLSSADPTERTAARRYVSATLERVGVSPSLSDDPAAVALRLARLDPDPDHPAFFEYNFLALLAAGGRADKSALGDHSPAGYAQRARFYAVSPATRFAFARNIAAYIIFLAETTGIVPAGVCAEARVRLDRCRDLKDLEELP